jgi:hypothetical protein
MKLINAARVYCFRFGYQGSFRNVGIKTTLISLKTSFQLLGGSFRELNYNSRAVDFVEERRLETISCFVCMMRAKAAARLYHKLGRREISPVMRVLCDFARPHAVCMHAMGSS